MGSMLIAPKSTKAAPTNSNNRATSQTRVNPW